MHRIRTSAVAAALAALALPAVASAATKDVAVGAVDKRAPKDASLNGFFPKNVTVRVGDSVRFSLAGFGVVHFPEKGDKAPGFVLPDPTKPVTGASDAAGNPFWFNGQPSLLVNPSVFFGTKSGAAYTGAKVANQGFPAGDGPPKPFVVRFPKAGTYTYYDAFHAGVTGTVKVVRNRSNVPSAKSDKARAAKQIAALVKTTKTLAQRRATDNTIVAGPDKGAATLFRFSPAAATAKVGQPVTLTMSAGTSENHTFTFGNDLKALAKLGEDFIGPMPGTGTAGPPVLQFDPRQAYPSGVEEVLTVDNAQHGDGFVNTGVLGGGRDGLPTSKKVVFTKPGTFGYLCLIHPDMQGKVTVTE